MSSSLILHISWKIGRKVRGIIITHGHEDHIGALPYILREINIPVYGTPLTIGLISEKLKEHDLNEKTNLIPIRPREVIEIGSFSVEGIRITHSIVDGIGFGITTPGGPYSAYRGFQV